MKYFAGLDVSLQETAICVVDEDGLIVSEGKVASDPDDLGRWLAATELAITRVGLEAGPLSPWLHAGLREAGLPAICIETRRMKGATAAMAVKTDRNDARAIAHAMRVGCSPPSTSRRQKARSSASCLAIAEHCWRSAWRLTTKSAARLRLSGSSSARSPSRLSRRGCWSCSPKDRDFWPWSAR
jgi:hypothetical protein